MRTLFAHSSYSHCHHLRTFPAQSLGRHGSLSQCAHSWPRTVYCCWVPRGKRSTLLFDAACHHNLCTLLWHNSSSPLLRYDELTLFLTLAQRSMPCHNSPRHGSIIDESRCCSSMSSALGSFYPHCALLFNAVSSPLLLQLFLSSSACCHSMHSRRCSLYLQRVCAAIQRGLISAVAVSIHDSDHERVLPFDTPPPLLSLPPTSVRCYSTRSHLRCCCFCP